MSDEAEFVWTPELIAEVARDMDRGIAILSQRRWSVADHRWVPVAPQDDR